jgi:hypothetical protein
LWRMPRFPILDRSREWKGDVMPTNVIAESGAVRGQVSRVVRKSYVRLSLVAALNLGSTTESAVMLKRNCSTLCGSIAS